VVEIGEDMAMPSDLTDLSERLAAVDYDGPAGDLVRFKSDPTDDAVGRLVDEIVTIDEEDRRLVIPNDSDQELVLDLYAERRTLAALRDHSLGLALAAWDARIVRPTWDYEDWRRDALYSAFVATQCGAMATALSQRAATVGGDDLVVHVDDVMSGLGRVGSLRDVGRVRVDSGHGVGVLELEIPRAGTYAYSVRGTGTLRTGARRPGFDPITNLAGAAVDVADDIETALGQSVVSFAASILPDTIILDPDDGEAPAEIACLLLSIVDPTTSDESVLCYVAEFDSDDGLGAIADEVNGEEQADIPRSAVVVGSRLGLVVAAPTFDDEPSEIDLGPFCEILAKRLGGHLEDAPT
jgi:hypothetical protein